jgi:hypothetical protein
MNVVIKIRKAFWSFVEREEDKVYKELLKFYMGAYEFKSSANVWLNT